MDGLQFQIRCEGQALDPEVEVLEIEVRRELFRIPEARLVLADGGASLGRFELSSRSLLLPGRQVSISLQAEGEAPVTVFDGLVLRHAVQSHGDGSSLRIEMKDAAFKLTRQRKSVVHSGKTDLAMIADVVRAAGLQFSGAADGPVHKELVQHHATDWDFILARADVQGLVVDVLGGKVTVSAMDDPPRTTRVFEYGVDQVFDFELEVDGAQQWAQMSSVGWDLAGQQPRGPESARQPAVGFGDLDPKDIAGRLGGDGCVLRHPVALDKDELQSWADGRLLRSRLSLLRGRLSIDCDPSLAPLDAVELRRIGDHFDGPVLVSAVTHRFDAEGWRTELGFGLPAQWYTQQPDIAEVAAAGLLPPVTGLQIAKVADFESDPAGEHRLRLQWPALDGSKEGSVWARVLQADAGPDRGCTFWPAPGDEVVVGFLANDPRQAVILGALHGSAQAPPAFVGAPTKAGGKGAIVSRRGAVIGYEDIDEGKSRITIRTPGGATFVLDDEAEKITLGDGKGNKLVLSDKGIAIETDQDLAIEAQGKVTIKGRKVDVQ